MYKNLNFFYNYFLRLLRTINVVFLKQKNRKIVRHYFGKKILNGTEGNKLIGNLFDSDEPFMVARFGNVELECIANYIHIQESKKLKGLKWMNFYIKGKNYYWENKLRWQVMVHAGVFPPTDEILNKFCTIFIDALKDIDVLGVWFNPLEDYFYNNYFPKAELVHLSSIEPYRYNYPWSIKLKNKKVLVVHPFEESINKQFKKREFLFTNSVLPEFELITYKAIQSAAFNKTDFYNWVDAYNYMCNEISKINFDIAIVGAGAYGLPLASYIKRMNKQVIHMGGATQLLFGIKGGRWNNHNIISKLYNQYWSNPLDSEIPVGYKLIENACYW